MVTFSLTQKFGAWYGPCPVALPEQHFSGSKVPRTRLSPGWGLGSRRCFSKENMAAKGKRPPKTTVFWSKDRILFKHFTHMIYVFSFNNIVIKVVNFAEGRDHLFDCKLIV